MSESEFLGQRKGEEVLEVFRKHPLVARKGYYVLIAALAIGLVPMLIWQVGWTVWFMIIAILAGLIYLAYQYILWYYTLFILTNERLRVIQQKGFFKRRTTDLELASVASVSVDTPNLFGAVFKYGTLHIQSNVGDMTVFFMSKPDRVCAEIQNAVFELGYKQPGSTNSGKKSAKRKETEPDEDEPRGEIIFDDDERMIV